jgi:CHASE1-domain containing sensor protein
MNPNAESATAILFGSLAVIVQTWAPTWVFITLILISMGATILGLYRMRLRERRFRLRQAMDAAFLTKGRQGHGSP